MDLDTPIEDSEELQTGRDAGMHEGGLSCRAHRRLQNQNLADDAEALQIQDLDSVAALAVEGTELGVASSVDSKLFLVVYSEALRSAPAS